jgi:hypothetical protein
MKPSPVNLSNQPHDGLDGRNLADRLPDGGGDIGPRRIEAVERRVAQKLMLDFPAFGSETVHGEKAHGLNLLSVESRRD